MVNWDHVITTLVKLIVNNLQSDVFQMTLQQNAKNDTFCFFKKSERKNSLGEEAIDIGHFYTFSYSITLFLKQRF